MLQLSQLSITALTALILITVGIEGKRKEIIVIGGGISGLAAARTIRNNKTADYNVIVYEARRDRYGGRIWTDKKNMPDAKGVEADLGAGALNTESPNNPLLNLTEKLELQTTQLGPLQLYIPKLDKKLSGKELVEYFVEARKIYLEAIFKVKEMTSDQSVQSIVSHVVTALKGQGQPEDIIVASILELLPSYNVPDFSSKLYQTDMLDFGYNTFLKDGMGELADRLVSGGDGEFPVYMELRKVVRQLQVDDKSKKIIVRLRDGDQTKVDAVVVAVPAAVIRDGSILFEPPLPAPYMKALNDIGSSFGNKIVVEFEEVFWPPETGVFLVAGEEKTDTGMMQKWLNMHKLVGRPVLVGFIGGPASLRYENMTDEEVKTVVRERLSGIFGSAGQSTEIVRILRSSWKTSKHSGVGSSYPKVGNDVKLWNTLSDPLCPYIFFAGEHTTYKGLGSLHGAYNSGVRAAQQFMSGLCEERAREEERKKLEEQKRKEKEKKKKEKKEGEMKKEKKEDKMKKDETDKTKNGNKDDQKDVDATDRGKDEL